MYANYCAACHGKEGRGNGPAAEALKVPPADLTALAKKNGGKYPSDHVSSAIKGDLEMTAHGSKEMPVWGNLFWQLSQGHTSEVQLRVSNLNRYIECCRRNEQRQISATRIASAIAILDSDYCLTAQPSD